MSRHNPITELAHKRTGEILAIAERNYFRTGGFIRNGLDRNQFANFMVRECLAIGDYMVQTQRWRTNYCRYDQDYLARAALIRARSYQTEA